jgi:hypothetical protein
VVVKLTAQQQQVHIAGCCSRGDFNARILFVYFFVLKGAAVYAKAPLKLQPKSKIKKKKIGTALRHENEAKKCSL